MRSHQHSASPIPPDDASLNQGVAALRRFLAAFPDHPRAVRAAFFLGESYRVRGKSTDALDAYTQFLKEDGFHAVTDAARRDWAELGMTASFHIGAILQGQQKFAEAIAAWKGYLAKFPNGPRVPTQTCNPRYPTADRRRPRPARRISRGPCRLERVS